MIITIKQHKASIGDGYDIYTNEKRTLSAYTEILTMDTIINLSEYGSDRAILSVEKMFSLFGPVYIIKRNGNEYMFDSVSWFKGHYKCVVGDTTYNIYGHFDNKYSVYKDEDQIAYWEGQSITFMEGDKYQLYADN